MLKKIYIEITNCCNFNCSFCCPSSRPKRHLSAQEFRTICTKIRPYTQYIYLHVLGEPLLHPQFEEILKLAKEENLFVNLTTNGSLLLKQQHSLLKNPPRQINISIHDWEENLSVEEQTNLLENTLSLCDKLSQTTYISLRLWNHTKETKGESLFNQSILKIISNHYQTDIVALENNTKSIKLAPHIFLHNDKRFSWPENTVFSTQSQPTYCFALKTHIAILSDGSVVPCCIDANAHLLLGNIFTDNLDVILSSPRAIKIRQGFQQHKAIEDFCKKCGFRETKL